MSHITPKLDSNNYTGKSNSEQSDWSRPRNNPLKPICKNENENIPVWNVFTDRKNIHEISNPSRK